MSEQPTGEAYFGSGVSGRPAGYSPSPSGDPVQRPSSTPRPPLNSARWPTVVVLVIALLALAVGVAALLRPMPLSSSPASPAYTAEQAGSAKTNVCGDYEAVKKVVTGNTHRTNPIAGDPEGALATGIYAPVALYDSGDFLLRGLADDKATPEALAKSIESFGKKLLKLAMVDLAGDPDSTRDSLRRELDSDVSTLDGLCK